MSLQAIAQTKPRAVHQDMHVGGGDADLGADFFGFHLDEFAHHEDAALVGGQVIEAGLDPVILQAQTVAEDSAAEKRTYALVDAYLKDVAGLI